MAFWAQKWKLHRTILKTFHYLLSTIFIFKNESLKQEIRKQLKQEKRWKLTQLNYVASLRIYLKVVKQLMRPSNERNFFAKYRHTSQKVSWTVFWNFKLLRHEQENVRKNDSLCNFMRILIQPTTPSTFRLKTSSGSHFIKDQDSISLFWQTRYRVKYSNVYRINYYSLSNRIQMKVCQSWFIPVFSWQIKRKRF